MVKADVEKGFLNGQGSASKSGIYQEIEVKNNNLIADKEIELSFILNHDKLHCLVEIDSGFGWSKNQYRSFTLPINATDKQINSLVSAIV